MLIIMYDSALIELCLFISQGIWLLRTRGIRRRAKEAGLGFDDFPEAVEWQDKGFKFPWVSRKEDKQREDQVASNELDDCPV